LHQDEVLRIYSTGSYLAVTNILTGYGLNILDTYLNSPLQPTSTLFSLSVLKRCISSAPQCTVHPGSSIHTHISQFRLFSSNTIICITDSAYPQLTAQYNRHPSSISPEYYYSYLKIVYSKEPTT
jgi:hypothetical protein